MKIISYLKTFGIFAFALIIQQITTIVFSVFNYIKDREIHNVKLSIQKLDINNGEEIISPLDLPTAMSGMVFGSVLGILFIIMASWLVNKKKPFSLLRLNSFSFKGGLLPIILFTCLLITNNLLESYITYEDLEKMSEMIIKSFENNAFLTVLGVGIFIPFFEEILFRGWLFDRLEHLLSSKYALIITSIMFGLVHGQYHGVILLLTIVSGFVLGFIRLRTNSLWPSIILHAINNTSSIFLAYYLG